MRTLSLMHPVSRADWRHKSSAIYLWMGVLVLGFLAQWAWYWLSPPAYKQAMVLGFTPFRYLGAFLVLPFVASLLGSMLSSDSLQHGSWPWLLGRPIPRKHFFRQRLLLDAVVFGVFVLLYTLMLLPETQKGLFLVFSLPLWLVFYGLGAFCSSLRWSTILGLLVTLVGGAVATFGSIFITASGMRSSSYLYYWLTSGNWKQPGYRTGVMTVLSYVPSFDLFLFVAVFGACGFFLVVGLKAAWFRWRETPQQGSAPPWLWKVGLFGALLYTAFFVAPLVMIVVAHLGGLLGLGS